MIIGPELINGLEYSWIKFDITCTHVFNFLICGIGTLSYEKKTDYNAMFGGKKSNYT